MIPGPVVGVLAAGLQVKVVQSPVLELLAEVLDTDLKRAQNTQNIAPQGPGNFLHD